MELHEALLQDPEFVKEFGGMLNPNGSVTIDRSRVHPPWSDVCSRCKRLYDPGIRRCEAFGDSPIPDDIWFGRDDHHTPRAGDGGLTFAPSP